jgi:hypothetical protein
MRNCVNVGDLIRSLGTYFDTTVVVENFRSDEYELLRGFIRGRSDVKWLFYCPNNNEEVAGMADELGFHVYMDLEEVLGEIDSRLSAEPWKVEDVYAWS